MHRRFLIKSLVCGWTWFWNCCCSCFTCYCWCLYLLPKCCYPYCGSSPILPLIIAAVLGEKIQFHHLDNHPKRSAQFNLHSYYAVGLFWVTIILACIAIAVFEGAVNCDISWRGVECTVVQEVTLPLFPMNNGTFFNQTIGK